MSVSGEQASVVHSGDVSATITVDLRFISQDAILRASYWFADTLIAEISQQCEEVAIVRVSLREKAPTLESPRVPDLNFLIADFRAAMLDAELRVRIARQTESVRELILAKAFAEAGVLEDLPPGTFADPVLERSGKNASEHLRILNPDAS